MTEEKIQEVEEKKVIYPYVSLHNYTNFSIFLSLIKPAALFKRAKELGMKAIAVTDLGVCAGLWDAWKESKSEIKLIAGCTFNFVDDVANKESRLRNIVLIAKNATGYKNLLKLSKEGFDNFIITRKNPTSRIDWKLLEKYKDGLICLTGDSSGIISRLLNDKNFEEAEIQAKHLQNIFGDDLAFELQPNALKRILNNFNESADQTYTNRQLKKLGEKLNIKLVAATNSLYVNKEDYQAHDAWLALGSGQPINSGNRLSFNVNDFYIKSGEEVFEFFRRTKGYKSDGTDEDGIKFAKELLLNSVILAKRCEKPEWIDPKFSNPSGFELPVFPVKDQYDYNEFLDWQKNQKQILDDNVQYLRFKCIKNYKLQISSKEEYSSIKNIYKERIYKELDVLEDRGLCGYMLIVSDFIEWSKKNNISIGPGRGSCAGSLVAYLLGIHEADPIKYGLVMERFHNKSKAGLADIDSDISAINRYKLEEYLINKYGASNVAHISNYNMMTPKPYVKAIARTFMYGGDRKEAVRIGTMLADLLPKEAKTVANIFEHSPLLAEYSKKYKELATYSKIFGNNPIAISTHAAGVIIGKRELAGLIPLRRDRDGNISVELHKDTAEETGMVKMDLLGLSTLDDIDNTYKLIKKNNKIIPYEKFNYHEYDKETYDLISRGDTMCVFQLGKSAGTIELCKKYQPKSIEDLAIITTLARPASKEIREDYFKVKNGEEKFELLHPLLERAFKETLGFALYDESLLILAEDIAGWDLAEADKLRKLTKEKGKNPAKVKKWKEEFIANALERKNIKTELSEKIWTDIIEPFGLYSFNKSHAVSYSLITFHTAYLKAHYPIEFLVANLMQKVQSGAKSAKDEVNKIKEEIRKTNINIVPPDINTSDQYYTIIDDKTLATGLSALKYMGQDAVPEILEKRPFSSFEDFLTRCDSSKVKAPAIQALAASGALSSFNMPRKQMFLYAADYKKKLQVWLKKKPEKRGDFSYVWPDEGEWSISEIYALEQFYIGEGLTGSKFEVYPGFFTKNHIHFDTFSKLLPPPPENLSEKDLKNYTKKANNVQGIVKDVFEFKVKKEKSKLFGQTMAKVTLEDPYGIQVNVTFFPEKWQYLHERIKDRNSKLKFEIGMALSIIGNIQWYDGNISVIFEELQEAKGAPQTPPKLELKSKKTVSVRKKKNEDVVDEDMDRQELLEEIEEELIENGFADLDDENEDENNWSD